MIIAGAINFTKEQNISLNEKKLLQTALSRKQEKNCHNLGDGHFFFTVVNHHLNDEDKKYCLEENDAVTFLMGNPYLENCREGNHYDYAKQLKIAHTSCIKRNWDIIKLNGRGVFAIIHFDKVQNELIFVSDKLGILPLYYWFDKKKIVFSSALRILENCSFVPLRVDIQGISETAAFGFSIGDRTPYEGIKRIGVAEIIQIKLEKKSQSVYYRWDSIKETKESDIGLLTEEAYSTFSDAIDLRLGNDSTVNSFLSGGLDSRCVVTMLKEKGCNVNSFNFSKPKSQDQFFARQLAEKLEIYYKEFDFTTGDDWMIWAVRMAKALSHKKMKIVDIPERSHLIWSGDGGSVGTGFVYLDHEIVQTAQKSNIREAINVFINHNKLYLAHKIFKKSFRNEFKDLIFNSIQRELIQFDYANLDKAFHLFLMCNDQRRHLDRHFEDMDLHQLEFHLPFFDSFYLEKVLSLPLSYCIGHNFYMKWFQKFPLIARSVPWQTYPGHVPCNLPSSQELDYQWDSSSRNSKERIQLRKIEAKKILKILFQKISQTSMLNKKILILACILQYYNIKNYEFLLSHAKIFIDFWKK